MFSLVVDTPINSGLGDTAPTSFDKVNVALSALNNWGGPLLPTGDPTIDTPALQAAVTAFTLAGGSLQLGNGVFNLNASISIGFSVGWKIRGASRLGTVLNMVTDNTPIFTFTADLTHSWSIESMTFKWKNNQPSTNTLANCLYFNAGANKNIFNWAVRDCLFSNGFRAMSTPSATATLLWGCTVEFCIFGGLMTGAAFCVSGSAAGLPNLRFRDLYIDCTSASEASFLIVNGDNVLFEGVEFNNGSYGAFGQILCTTCFAVLLLSVKTELVTVAGNSGNGTILWNFPQCQVVARAVKALSVTVSGSGHGTFISAGSGGSLSVSGYHGGATGSGNVFFMFNATTILRTEGRDISGIATDNARPVLGNVPAARLNLDNKTMDVTQFQAITTGSYNPLITDANIIYFNNQLTGNITCALPSNSGLDGPTFSFRREFNGSPSAFSITITDAISGLSRVIPNSTNGWVNVRATGTGGWFTESMGTIT